KERHGSCEAHSVSSSLWQCLSLYLLSCSETITNYRHFNYNSHCVIVLYRLSGCGVTDEGCAALASALRSNPSHLRELNLSLNKLGDSSRKFLSDLRMDPHYKLETLYC
uniref:Uncharacterized protein n=1 Tax=Cyprinus carpio carpio TaxID=630221 RepID=A0A9J7ZYH3_CYPCA